MQSYKLRIKLNRTIEIRVGKLGSFKFPEGLYIYMGSAKQNLEGRIQRHLQKFKKLHWHIDYLLVNAKAHVISVERSTSSECALNQKVKGQILIPGFGSSDCLKKCGSHLKYFGLSRDVDLRNTSQID